MVLTTRENSFSSFATSERGPKFETASMVNLRLSYAVISQTGPNDPLFYDKVSSALNRINTLDIFDKMCDDRTSLEGIKSKLLFLEV